MDEFLCSQNLDEYLNKSRNTVASAITIHVKCTYNEAFDPNTSITRQGAINVKGSDKVDKIITAFRSTFKDIPDQTYYVGYDQQLFKSGTVAECGITQDKHIELYSPGKNQAAYNNEGHRFILWSIVPFVIGLSCLLFAIFTSTYVENQFQALFLYLGLIITIPTGILIVLGLILVKDSFMPCYFNGTDWV